jgi:predicted DNA-binding protein
MERTQIYFEKAEKEKLMKIAKKMGKPMAKVIREAVAEYLVREKELLKPENDPIAELKGFLKGGKFTTEAYLQQKKQDKESEER